jgi:tRNA A37 methylthiotransferase MiaB
LPTSWNPQATPRSNSRRGDLILINSCAFLQSALAEFDEILSGYADRKNQGEFETLIVSGA